MSSVNKIFSLKWFFKIIGLKSIYQFLYIAFVLLVMKNLNVDDYGTYSYVLSIILYFSAIPLLGLPLYLQKHIARKNIINIRYFYLALTSVLFGLVTAFLILPNIGNMQKLFVLAIIAYNTLTAILVAVNDGIGKYSKQYMYLLIASIWMIFSITDVVIFHKSLTINLILRYWVINSTVVFIIAFINLLKVSFTLQFTREARPYSLILIDLLLMYSVSIPDGFAKFYDKYLANKYLSTTFLGNYSFNLMLVVTAYAFFIRPMNSFFINQIAKNQNSITICSMLIRNFYCFAISIYVFIYCLYTLFSENILLIAGLERYLGTTHLFKICFLNIILYILAYPFIILLAMSGNNRNKLIYCISSIAIFNIPALFLAINGNVYNFLFGFILAYLLNFLLVIIFEYQYAKNLIYFLLNDVSLIIKHTSKLAISFIKLD